MCEKAARIAEINYALGKLSNLKVAETEAHKKQRVLLKAELSRLRNGDADARPVEEIYGFTCGYCGEHLNSPYAKGDHHSAEDFAQEHGWRITLGHTDPFGGNAHVTCPNCLPAFSEAVTCSINGNRKVAPSPDAQPAIPALSQGEGSEPVGWQHRLAGSPNERWFECSKEGFDNPVEGVEYRTLYASPPPLPAGSAIDILRDVHKFLSAGWDALGREMAEGSQGREIEALEKVRQSIVLAIAFLNRDHGTDRAAKTVPQIVKGLADADETLRALPSPQSQGLVNAAEWRSMENAPRKDGTRILMNTGDYIGVYRYSSGNKIYDFKTWQPEGNERHGHIFANDYGERGCKWCAS